MTYARQPRHSTTNHRQTDRKAGGKRTGSSCLELPLFVAIVWAMSVIAAMRPLPRSQNCSFGLVMLALRIGHYAP
eukprot:118028-Rhodomonas_salina.1